MNDLFRSNSRTTYWSCTKFADWIRGTAKPKAATGDGWDNWHKIAKKTHSFRYWLSEEFLDAAQRVVCFPIDFLYNIKYYINNRWVTRTHALTSHPKDIKRGQWRDVGNRFLPCLFNELVEFVEIEQAWHHVAWDKEARAKYKPPFWGWGWFRWRTWRCPEAGLAYLDWAMTLTDEEFLPDDKKHEAKPTRQAESAREIKELYTWWKEIYPKRVDPMEASGWSAYCDRRREQIKQQDPDAEHVLSFFRTENDTEEDREESRRILDLSYKIETEQNDEDENMMIRLIRIRQSLWT